MNSFCHLFVLLLLITTQLFAFERVPKQFSLATGGIYLHRNDIFQEKDPGITVMFDYSWQLSGLDGTRPSSYISVPLGYSHFFTTSKLSIFSYGWTVRHNLLKQKKIIPFLGYGLLLNQLHYEPEKGKRYGHQTRFDAGCELHTGKPVTLFTKLEWSMTRFPQRFVDEIDKLYTVVIKIGVRYNKPPRKRKRNRKKGEK